MLFKLLRLVIRPETKIQLIINGSNAFEGKMIKLLDGTFYDGEGYDRELIRYQKTWETIEFFDNFEVKDVSGSFDRNTLRIELEG